MDRTLLTQLISVIIFSLIVYGVTVRTEREKHMKIMLSAFVLDVLLVFFIEFGRNAVAKALGFPGGLLGFHIIVSVLTILLYIWMIFTGFKLYKNDEEYRFLHRNLAYAFLGCRTINLITSFFI